MNFKTLFKGKDNILSKGIASTVIKVLGALSSYFLSYLIAKKFGASGNGVFALFMTYTIILSTFFYLGLDFFLVKHVSVLLREKKHKEIKTIYNKICIKYIAPFSVLFLLIGTSLYWYFDYVLILFVTLGVMINIFVDINSAVLRGMKEAEWYSFFIQFSKHFITVILFLLPIYFEKSEGILYLYLASLFVNGILSFFILNKKINNLSNDDEINEVKKYSMISIFMSSKEFFFASIIIITLIWVDFILIDIFLDEIDAGVYSIALKLATLVSFGFTSFNAFLAPRISEIYAERDMNKLQKVLTQNFMLVFPMLLIPLIVILFFHETLLTFFGDEFKSGWKILLLLAGGQFINSIFGPVSLLLQMTNHQKIFQNILVITFVFKLIFALIFVQLYGAEGIALASFLGLSLWTIAGSYFVYKKIGVYSWFGIKEMKNIFSNE